MCNADGNKSIKNGDCRCFTSKFKKTYLVRKLNQFKWNKCLCKKYLFFISTAYGRNDVCQELWSNFDKNFDPQANITEYLQLLSQNYVME